MGCMNFVQTPRDCLVGTIYAMCHESIAAVVLEHGEATLASMGQILGILWDRQQQPKSGGPPEGVFGISGVDVSIADPLGALEGQAICLLALIVEQGKRIKGAPWVEARLPLASIGLSFEADPVKFAMYEKLGRANALAFLEKRMTIRKGDIDKHLKRLSLGGDMSMDDDAPEEPSEAAEREAVAEIVDAHGRRMDEAIRGQEREAAVGYKARRVAEMKARYGTGGGKPQ